ncbi:MAG: hypothetical protein IID14_07100 [Candidatus Marinimicrobia bacterium]|nr:hypothetical protein [Candidatus Neomarinimicrobiota bacterium]
MSNSVPTATISALTVGPSMPPACMPPSMPYAAQAWREYTTRCGVALRLVVGQRSIDDVLTVEKEAVQADTLLLLQEILDSYFPPGFPGIEIQEVRLLNVRPPDAVRDAFDDVVRARVDKESRINEALAYQQAQLAKTRRAAQ